MASKKFRVIEMSEEKFVPEKWLSLRIDGWINFEVKSSYNFYRSKVLRTRVPKLLKTQVDLALRKCNCLTVEIIPWDQFDDEKEDV